MFFRIMLGSILRRKARMLTVLLAVTVGTGIASALLNFYYDVQWKMTRELRTRGANLVVAPAGAVAAAADATAPGGGQTPAWMDEATVQALRDTLVGRPILAQAPYYYTAGKSGSVYLTVVGTDVQGLRALSRWWKVDGEWMREKTDPPSCMVGRQVARQLGLGQGQTLRLRGGGTGSPTDYALRIAGIVETGSSEENQVFVPLATGWAIGGQNGKVNTVALNVLGTGADVERLAQTIEERLPGLRAKPIRQIAQSEGWILAKIKWMLLITTGIILIITALCAMTTLAALVLERSKEMALMKALGAGRTDVVKLLFGEVTALGIVGGLAGYFVGLGLAHLLEQHLFHSGITVRPILLPVIIVIACGLLMGSGLLAVRRAMEIQPAVLLKGE